MLKKKTIRAKTRTRKEKEESKYDRARRQKREADEKLAEKYFEQFELMYDSGRELLGMTVVDRVEELRLLDGRDQWTQRDVGIRAGITTRSYQSQWYGNIRKRAKEGSWNPTFRTVVRLSIALSSEGKKVTPADLMEPFR